MRSLGLMLCLCLSIPARSEDACSAVKKGCAAYRDAAELEIKDLEIDLHDRDAIHLQDQKHIEELSKQLAAKDAPLISPLGAGLLGVAALAAAALLLTRRK